MQDSEINVGMRVKIQEAQQSAPLNGAVGTVVEIGEFDHAPICTVEVYGASYRFRAYELQEAR